VGHQSGRKLEMKVATYVWILILALFSVFVIFRDTYCGDDSLEIRKEDVAQAGIQYLLDNPSTIKELSGAKNRAALGLLQSLLGKSADRKDQRAVANAGASSVNVNLGQGNSGMIQQAPPQVFAHQGYMYLLANNNLYMLDSNQVYLIGSLGEGAGEPTAIDNTPTYDKEGNLIAPYGHYEGQPKSTDKAKGKILGVWDRHGVFKDGQKGMEIRVEVNIQHNLGWKNIVEVYFRDRQGLFGKTWTDVFDNDRMYCNNDGQAATFSEIITPDDENYIVTVTLFMPYAQFDDVNTKGKFREAGYGIRLWDCSKSKPRKIAKKELFEFRLCRDNSLMLSKPKK
jgi:hypothetical protein